MPQIGAECQTINQNANAASLQNLRKKFCINNLSTFFVKISKRSFELIARFFSDTCRPLIETKDVGGNSDKAKLLESILGHSLQCFGHDALAPVRFCKPVTRLGLVNFAQFKIVKSNSANEGAIRLSDRPVGRVTPFLGGLGDVVDPPVGVRLRIGKWNCESLIGYLLYLEMFEISRLVSGSDVSDVKS